MIEPIHIIDEVRQRLHVSQPLSVFWVTLSTDRDDFARKLMEMRKELPIVPWALRSPGFTDPNSVMNDVTDILDQTRNDIEIVSESAIQWNCIVLILLSRRELNLAVTSSPILLPNWFPILPKQMISARIDDLTWSVGVLISDKISALDELRRILYEIDHALIIKLEKSMAMDHNKVQSLWSYISCKDDDKIAVELSKAKRQLHLIQNPTGYRPSAWRNPTIVGRLWHKANTTAPDSLRKMAKALAEALDLGGGIDYDDIPLISVLNRPTNPITNSSERWSFCLIVALRVACQLVTAAAHADEYPKFPIHLLRSISRDLRRFLDTAVVALQRSTNMTQAENGSS